MLKRFALIALACDQQIGPQACIPQMCGITIHMVRPLSCSERQLTPTATLSCPCAEASAWARAVWGTGRPAARGENVTIAHGKAALCTSHAWRGGLVHIPCMARRLHGEVALCTSHAYPHSLIAFASQHEIELFSP